MDSGEVLRARRGAVVTAPAGETSIDACEGEEGILVCFEKSQRRGRGEGTHRSCLENGLLNGFALELASDAAVALGTATGLGLAARRLFWRRAVD